MIKNRLAINMILIAVLIVVITILAFLIYQRISLPVEEEPSSTEEIAEIKDEKTAEIGAEKQQDDNESANENLEDNTESATEATEESKDTGTDIKVLESLIDEKIAGLDSKWSVWAENLSSGESISCCHNTEKETPMVSASLIKLFIMAAVYDKIETGEIKETDTVKSDLSKMITISDNDASNRLIKLLGGGNKKSDCAELGMATVNAYAASIDCNQTTIKRLLLGNNGLQNYTTSEDCARILRMIYKGECVNSERSGEMLKLLLAQTIANKIPAGIDSKSVKIANKTGELPGISECDVAIVFSENCDYILCVMAEKPLSDSAAIDVIKDVSAVAYNYFAGANGEKKEQ